MVYISSFAMHACGIFSDSSRKSEDFQLKYVRIHLIWENRLFVVHNAADESDK